MNDRPQGPGWWQASDGNWYAPEQHPDPAQRAQYASPAPTDAIPADPGSPDPAATGPSTAGTPSTDPRATVGPQGFAVPGGNAPSAAPGTPPSYGAPPSPGGPPPSTPSSAPPAYGAPPASPAPYGSPPSYGSPPPAVGIPGGAGASSYAATLTVDRAPSIARWRAFAHIFMLIPHAIVLYLVSLIANIVTLLSWFVILFTGKLPRGFHDFQTMVLRYTNRTAGFALLLTEEYPPFDFTSSAEDPGTYPIRTDVAYVEEHNRVTTFFRFFLLIPQVIVFYFVALVAYLAYFVGWFAVLFTGRMPDGIANFLIGAGRWSTRLNAYARLLTDVYPPFSID